MNIHRIYYPTLALGPGRRIGIWTRGCGRACPNCMSPDLWETRPECEMDLRAVQTVVASMASRVGADGVTISGGEPLEQAPELMRLLEFLSGVTNDALLYTGYDEAGLEKLGYLERLKELCAAIVCGPYVEEKNDGSPLKGSSNQTILFRDKETRARYAPLLEGNRVIQPVRAGGEIFLIGIL